MAASGNIDKSKTIQQNLSYYDEVARTYNAIIDQDKTNQVVRQKVKETFLSFVKSGTVIDFGGGTGLDLEWLSAAGYKIVFCEPSSSMREKAMEYNNTVLQNPLIIFVDPPKTDFEKWHTYPPFSEPVDAMLSNFGVINYIQDINNLFCSIAAVVRPGGHFIAIMLDFTLNKRLKWHRRNAIRSLLFRVPFKMYIPYKDQRQTVFVHTVKEIKKASAKYFDYFETDAPKIFDFTLIHLVRNEKPYKEMVNG